MAIQLQIRRGTTAENDVFTGAVGELTMDTDTNGVRIHDGTTTGGVKIPTASTADYVVEWQMPTDLNGYTWYRKYKSGWVEQGGRVSLNGVISATNKRVTFPVEMANSKYNASVDINANVGAVAYVGWESTTGMSVGLLSGTSTGQTSWRVAGMAKQ